MLRNYSEQACDGDFLSVRCPPRTTITVQSAFYGRRGASDLPQCPPTYQALLSSYTAWEDERYCSVSTALQVGDLKEFVSENNLSVITLVTFSYIPHHWWTTPLLISPLCPRPFLSLLLAFILQFVHSYTQTHTFKIKAPLERKCPVKLSMGNIFEDHADCVMLCEDVFRQITPAKEEACLFP